jgi:hypothetical protein
MLVLEVVLIDWGLISFFQVMAMGGWVCVDGYV